MQYIVVKLLVNCYPTRWGANRLGVYGYKFYGIANIVDIILYLFNFTKNILLKNKFQLFSHP